MSKTVALIAGLGLLTLAGPASAGLYKAGSISEVLDIPTLLPALGPRIFSVENRQFTPHTFTIPELTDSEELQNPSGFNGYLSVDTEPGTYPFDNPLPNTVTLRHEETNTGYQIAKITIGDIEFDSPDEFIAGITLNSGGIIDTQNSDPFTQTVEFTDDSITFLFQVRDMVPGQIFHFLVDGSIQYLVDIGVRTADIPEPASLLLFGASLAGLGVSGRRRDRTA